MYSFDRKLASAENVIVCNEKRNELSGYKLQQLSYKNIRISDRSLAWSITEGSELEAKLLKEVDEYNSYVDLVIKNKEFSTEFAKNNCCLHKSKVVEICGKEFADKLFAIPHYAFDTELVVRDEFIFDDRYSKDYSALICGSDEVIPIGNNGDIYPQTIAGKKALWNWIDNGHDFCLDIWELLGGHYVKTDDDYNNDDAIIYQFDAYDQFRHEAAEPQLVRIFKKLESLGYIETFTLKPATEDPRWSYYGKNDGTIDVALVDMSFKRNRLLMEQIELILWSKPLDVLEKHYILTSDDNKQFLSAKPGKFGGNVEQKIYGKLNCASALRYLKKGQYAKNRVFFADEETAIKAGYRPCGICMKDEYKKWKALNG